MQDTKPPVELILILLIQLPFVLIEHILGRNRFIVSLQGIKRCEDLCPLSHIHAGMPEAEGICFAMLRFSFQENIFVAEIFRHGKIIDGRHISAASLLKQ